STPLREIIRNDCRVENYKGGWGTGEVIIRQGDYGNSMFFILDGAVHIVPDALPPQMLLRAEVSKRGVLGALAQLVTNHRAPEYRDAEKYGAARGGRIREDRVEVDMQPILDNFKPIPKSQGEIFGEVAVLTRMPRTASVFADGNVQLLEIRWQGIRDIMRRDDAIRRWINKRYRETALNQAIKRTPYFSHLNEQELQKVADATVFETYGEMDWYTSYQKLAGQDDPAKRLAHEPIIIEEGTYPNGLIIIRAGFARLSMRFGNGERTQSYLGEGKSYGFDEIAHNFHHRTEPPIALRRTLRAVGYVDVLRIPTVTVEKYVLERPETRQEAVQLAQVVEAGPAQAGGKRLRSSMVEFLVENRYINGSATMIIDLDRCTRCDDCVRACANGHDNNPRFIRHGPKFDHYMIANACMHCADPVCMIGCPTGAISRNAAGGQVVIDDVLCIGCATCANSCPYSNIRMVEIRDERGQFIIDKEKHTPIVKATKCDLCMDQMGGPACQRACPHDALKRVNLQDLGELGDWLQR
ncbi:MAG: cyclic nucleotide-binding domain-containing protein, partial [Gemmatimonadetes bacterium]|nr:cyclic nucleotide-binding domain-containing protein [Gemmatimonadota bacterium]